MHLDRCGPERKELSQQHGGTADCRQSQRHEKHDRHVASGPLVERWCAWHRRRLLDQWRQHLERNHPASRCLLRRHQGLQAGHLPAQLGPLGIVRSRRNRVCVRACVQSWGSKLGQCGGGGDLYRRRRPLEQCTGDRRLRFHPVCAEHRQELDHRRPADGGHGLHGLGHADQPDRPAGRQSAHSVLHRPGLLLNDDEWRCGLDPGQGHHQHAAAAADDRQYHPRRPQHQAPHALRLHKLDHAAQHALPGNTHHPVRSVCEVDGWRHDLDRSAGNRAIQQSRCARPEHRPAAACRRRPRGSGYRSE